MEKVAKLDKSQVGKERDSRPGRTAKRHKGVPSMPTGGPQNTTSETRPGNVRGKHTERVIDRVGKKTPRTGAEQGRIRRQIKTLADRGLFRGTTEGKGKAADGDQEPGKKYSIADRLHPSVPVFEFEKETSTSMEILLRDAASSIYEGGTDLWLHQPEEIDALSSAMALYGIPPESKDKREPKRKATAADYRAVRKVLEEMKSRDPRSVTDGAIRSLIELQIAVLPAELEEIKRRKPPKPPVRSRSQVAWKFGGSTKWAAQNVWLMHLGDFQRQQARDRARNLREAEELPTLLENQ